MHKRTCISASILRTKHRKSVDANREHRHMTWCQGGGDRPSHGPGRHQAAAEPSGTQSSVLWVLRLLSPHSKGSPSSWETPGAPVAPKILGGEPRASITDEVMSRVVRYVLTRTDVLILLSAQLQIGRGWKTRITPPRVVTSC